MDEPLASLDGPRKAEVLAYIERLRDEFEVPILYVSHSVEEVLRLARTWSYSKAVLPSPPGRSTTYCRSRRSRACFRRLKQRRCSTARYVRTMNATA